MELDDRALNDPKHSDLTVMVQDTSFYVHKVLLALRTSFFTDATEDKVEEAKESIEGTKENVEEAKKNIVTIRDHSVGAVRGFLEYCYTGDYSNKESEPEPPTAPKPDNGLPHAVLII